MSDNEMLKLADRIERQDLEFKSEGVFLSDAESDLIVSALRAAAASAEPVKRDLTQVEKMLVTQALFTSGTPAPDAEIVAALEEIRREAATANEIIRLKRGKEGQGFVRIATALHRIERLAKAKGGSEP